MDKRAIIVPFRDRLSHLQTFLPAMDKYGLPVIVIEQADDKPFNRAKLLNIAVWEYDYTHYIFHDVDMIPLEADYSPSEYPCHLATQVEQFDYKMPYREYFGGVTMVPVDKFKQVNGFSNEYFGWGGEDDDLLRKFRTSGIPILSRDCRFNSLAHERIIDPLLRMRNIDRLHAPINWEDGLSSCKYEVVGKDATYLKVLL